ncbi:MAG TPA: DNA-directed RNA polymerase subunit beta' [Longimicrobiaceae bacterium]|nr:DNA-directed RNA polymerase subunit beta' [Longimicrobiaceae bacterium]
MIDFPRVRETRSQDFNYIQVKLASPEEIRGWSFGEVTKPETINYRSFKPERDGLFCERIFGPVKDWECHCGKFKRIRFRGHVCDKCGVEVTLSKVRRERMGHIELAVPVAHIWMFKTLPSQMGYLLGMTLRDLEKVIYYASYVVTHPGSQDVKHSQALDEDEYIQLREKAREENDTEFQADIGATAVRTLLGHLDVDTLAEELRAQVATETSQHRKKMVLKRLKVIDAIRNSGNIPSERNRPEWMILDVIPVIPPDLRPLVPLDGGRFATSDLNDLYRRVINRNNRLKKLMEMRAPEVILRNEKRMLQEAVDALFDNGRRSKAIRGRGKRPLKSLSDMLKGKQGRFRQNLLGKRVDYSGRSVIVVGPELKLHQCGLPKAMAVELFKPFIIHELEKRGEAETVKRAKKIVERDDPRVYEVLEDIIRDHPVLLNRAPTLHRLGIQAFEPVLVEGKAIRIHPLVCAAFNADFDGDQMAVHVPLSFEAQLEARVLMLSSNNILLPSNGRPIAAPSQDIVIGAYWLTKDSPEFAAEFATDAQELKKPFSKQDPKNIVHRVASVAEVEMAMQHGHLELQSPVWFLTDPRPASELEEGEERTKRWIQTTVGRVIFNSVVPEALGFWNRTMGKKELGDVIFSAYRTVGLARTVVFLDDLKAFGFRYSTAGGVSVGIEDMKIPADKEQILREAEDDVARFTRAYNNGVISNGERYNKVIDTWTHANNDVADAMVARLAADRSGFNPVFMMMNSGARGSRDQMRQLAGMRGLMAKPQKKLTGGIGEIIESPIKSNFREGLTVLEYFISTHGARKGLADTALKTADAGYLTRRLVDVAQDVTISEEDCNTILGLEVSALKEGEDVVEPLKDRIVGSVAADDVVDPMDGEVLVTAGELIDEEAADEIEEAGIQTVKIRSVLTCESRRGLCRQCYGRNLATMGMVDLGEAVGILAAQSIGEPGTQLTLRTFHIGGTAARIAATTARKSKVEGVAQFDRITTVTTPDGSRIVTSREGEIIMRGPDGGVRSRLAVPYGSTISVEDGQKIAKDDLLFSWDPYSEPIVADFGGTIRFIDISDEETVREELDESTGRRQMVIIEDRSKKLHPMIEIVDAHGAKLREFIIPVGAQLTVRDGEKIEPGASLAKIAREAYKTRDITGGLPRIAELFEARKPKDPAVITEIDGTVRFGDIKRGKREVIVIPQSGNERIYEVPVGKHLRVHEGDFVRAGDRLSEGPVNPHDILRIKGPQAVQEYLLNEVQEVYRLQGVKINDKHIGAIIRQMLQKVRIVDPGHTEFLEAETVDRVVFLDENARAIAAGTDPARSEPLLLGITKASLTTQSFISAASFQETTRVLTDAAIRGARDNLAGLKENIIIGHLIPAGTGIYRYHDVNFGNEQEAAAAPAAEPAVETAAVATAEA